MSKDFQIAHAWGKHCKNCGNVFKEGLDYCPLCGEELCMVMSAFKVPKGSIFVYDDGRIPGGNDWKLVSEAEYVAWQDSIKHLRPGKH